DGDRVRGGSAVARVGLRLGGNGGKRERGARQRQAGHDATGCAQFVAEHAFFSETILKVAEGGGASERTTPLRGGSGKLRPRFSAIHERVNAPRRSGPTRTLAGDSQISLTIRPRSAFTINLS